MPMTQEKRRRVGRCQSFGAYELATVVDVAT
eukprot:CAMPEP_0168756192 /NCGR_PEP_ID=MMETSP0724-20121128/20470_1 /TAXON_ID=265536 /ORGANISM="Amphiprora sp., Strain CCMP467" /LENGTH=30 /DNA_ID= /DNA_START= /DNA_END= /DNA_ORIENTATION=